MGREGENMVSYVLPLKASFQKRYISHWLARAKHMAKPDDSREGNGPGRDGPSRQGQ